MAETAVDVMVVYSEQMLLEYGDADGVEAHVLANIASSNQAMVNSRVDMRFRLVHLMPVAYSENGFDMGADLDALTAGDGVMDTVHSARDEYGADLVCLFRSRNAVEGNREVLGLAWILDTASGASSKGFSVVSAEHSLSSHVLTHELGHNFGAAHDRENASNSGLYSYSYGYRFRPAGEDQFRTVMAYAPGVRLNQFSSPDTTHLGGVTGTSSEDNARGLRQTMTTISRYRDHIHQLPIARAGVDRVIEDRDGDGFASVVLDGQDSFAEDGVSSWEWTWEGGTSDTAGFEVELPLGTTVFHLKIVDRDGYESRDQVTVKVLEGGEVAKVLTELRRSLVLKDNGLVYLFGESYESDGFYSWEWASWDRETPFMEANVVDMALGYDFALFVLEDGSLWGVGDNRSSQLGLSEARVYSRPVRLLESGVVSVAAYVSHSFFVKNDGSVWGMGTVYQSGQFGLGAQRLCEVPTKIVEDGASEVVTGYRNSFFLMKDGSVLATGLNDRGQLGLGSNSNQWLVESPIEILAAGVGVVSMAGGEEHTLFLKEDGSLWGMGSNEMGQLGAIARESYSSPVLVHEGPISSIGAREELSYYVMSSGALWMTGSRSDSFGNRYPFLDQWQLGPTEVLAGGVEAFTLGASHAMILRDDGSLWGIGENEYERLGFDGLAAPYVMQQAISGSGDRVNLGPVADVGEDIEYADWDGDGIAAVDFRSEIELSDDWQIKGVSWSFGDELSDDRLLRVKDFPVGETILAVNVMDDEGLVASDQKKVVVNPYAGVAAVSHFGQQALVLKEDGSAWLAGWHANDRAVWPDLLFSRDIRRIVGGEQHCFLIDERGTLWGMGTNERGELGLGAELSFDEPMIVRQSGVVSAATGRYFSLFVTSDGALWGMGANGSGQLGIGSMDGPEGIVQIVGSEVTEVVAGNDLSFFVKADGSLWGMGAGYSGLLGEANLQNVVLEPVQLRPSGVRNIVSGTDCLAYIDESGDLWGFGSNSSILRREGRVSPSDPVLLLEGPVKSLAMDGSSMMALYEDGKVVVLGYSLKRELGIDGPWGVWGESVLYRSGAIAVSLSGSGRYIIRSDGSLWMSGSGPLSQNSNGNSGRPWMRLAGTRPAPGSPPVAVAADDFQVVDFGGDGVEEIVLDGFDSYDEWEIAEWIWSWEIDGELQATTGRVARASLSVGEHRIQLQVRDNDGYESNDTIIVFVGGESVISDISLGADQTLFIDKSGALFGGGVNRAGNLGLLVDGDNAGFRLVRPSGVISASMGQSHSLHIDEAGALWALGAYGDSRLGVGDKWYLAGRPVRVIDSGVVQCVAGISHSCAIMEDGSLWTWGLNYDGQLGDGTFLQSKKPMKIAASGVVKVVAGSHSTVFLKDDGSLWGTGYLHRFWKPGSGVEKKNIPVLLYDSGVSDFDCTSGRLVVLKEDGSLWEETTDGTLALYHKGIVAFTSNSDYTMMLDDKRTLWASGDLYKLRLRPDSTPSSLYKLMEDDIISLQSSRNNTILRFADGRLWGAGSHSRGELGLGTGSGTGWQEIQSRVGSNDIVVPELYAGQDQLLFLREESSEVPLYLVGNEAAIRNAVAWRWSDEGGDIGKGSFAKVDHSQVGRFQYQLEITDSEGTKRSDALWVELRPYEEFRSWALHYFSAEQIDSEQFEKEDLDGDFLDNTMEMHLGRNPLVADADFGSRYFVLDGVSYIEILDPNPALTYVLWKGSDLSNWRPLREKEPLWLGERLVFQIDPEEMQFYRYSIAKDLSE